jgi:ribosomal protein RSM22 (predicted rRNA methylase)
LFPNWARYRVSRAHGNSWAAARIVGRPRHHPGLIELDTCTPEGLTTVRAGKRDRDRFRAARHAEWGAPGI